MCGIATLSSNFFIWLNESYGFLEEVFHGSLRSPYHQSCLHYSHFLNCVWQLESPPQSDFATELMPFKLLLRRLSAYNENLIWAINCECNCIWLLEILMFIVLAKRSNVNFNCGQMTSRAMHFARAFVLCKRCAFQRKTFSFSHTECNRYYVMLNASLRIVFALWIIRRKFINSFMWFARFNVVRKYRKAQSACELAVIYEHI